MIDLSRPQGVLLANATATAATTKLVGVSWVARANSLAAGQVWRLTFWFTYLHTAAATPTLTFDIASGGVGLSTLVVTPVATAGTYHGKCECVFTVRTAGAGGTIMTALQVSVNGLSSVPDPALVDVATDVINTTTNNTFELRVNMTTAVAGNTVTISQGYPERVVG